MRKKIVGLFVCMLLITTILPLTVLAGDPENPEFVDKIRDVNLFGVIPIPLQMQYTYADIVAAWLHEENANPEYLSVSLQIRDLVEKTESLEAIYDISLTCKNDRFIVMLHINPEGIHPFWVGRFLDESNDIAQWFECEGTADIDTNVITWLVPKEFLGNPSKGSRITSIDPLAILRFTDVSGLPLIDLFKDLPWNAMTSKDYVIQY